MQRDIGDIIDRWSIAKLKSERNPHPDSLKEYLAFEKELKKQKKKRIIMFITLERLANYIYKINGFIWDLESDLRKGYIDGDKERTANAAIAIRKYNSLRTEFKNIVNIIYKDGFQDYKKDHLSE